MNAVREILHQYEAALREEPKVRAFAFAVFVEDIGVAASTWASTLLMTNLFTDQRTRASVMLPTLACFLAGTLISGPLADWAKPESLARFRYQLVVWARLIETVMLGVMIVQLGTGGAPSVAKVAPFMMLTAFTKTAFRPARTAFSVDLLKREAIQRDIAGRPLLDERGEPLMYKTHLLTFSSLIGVLSSAAVLVGLLVGGQLMALAHGAYTPLLCAQLVAQLGFVGIVALCCHPAKSARQVGLRDLWLHNPAGSTPAARFALLDRVSQFFVAQWEVLRFLCQRQQRSLVALLAGGALVEFVTESYDGKMIIKHILHGSDDSLRYAEIALAVAGLLGVAAVPALTRSLGRLGRIFIVTMLLDGIAIALAGSAARAQVATAVAPFTAILVVDQSLTLISGSLRDLAQNSASSAAMRGRIHGAYAVFVILGDMLTQELAAIVSEGAGIPNMLVQVGWLQVVVVIGLTMLGGRGLWQLGLREHGESAQQAVSA